jgi:hypothetical protein
VYRVRDEIVRLQDLIKKLEIELHDCCLDALEIGELANKVHMRDSDSQSVAIAVNDACGNLYHKYDYRVRGYDAENIILDDFDGY